MPEPMENPYLKHGAHPCETRASHGTAWTLSFLFLLICSLAPFWRNAKEFSQGAEGWTPVVEIFRYSPSRGTLLEHLRDAEAKIEDAPYTEAPRRWVQGLLTSGLREGNRTAVIGRDGWLYFRPAIDALAGYGPLRPEPDTVAKDPNRESWRGPLDAILRFQEQLAGFGTELILVPVPVKPMIYPEHLGAKPAESPLVHRDAEAFYQRLREAGVQVLDLSAAFHAMKEDGPVFLKQDTHWTPAAMEEAARLVAGHLRQRPWFDGLAGEAPRFAAGTPRETRETRASGDLVERLELPRGSRAFGLESARITPVTAADGAAAPVFDTASPVVLLGDSFTNIFHQEDMGWGADSGFAQHLAKELNLPLDTIARNGQASTGVRRALAVRPDAAKRMRETKKAVVWAIAARDLFLSETAARDDQNNQIRWDDVEFRTDSDPAQDIQWPVVLEGTIEMTSSYLDPRDAPYPASLFACEYKVDRVISGTYLEDTALVFHWAFQDRERSPEGRFQKGETHRLTLMPLDARDELRGVNQSNDSARFDLVPAWAEGTRVLSGARGESDLEISEAQAARAASAATGAFSLLFGGVILAIYRRKRAERAAAREQPGPA